MFYRHFNQYVNYFSDGRPSTLIESVMSHMGILPPAMPVMFPGISDLITAFDEHCITNKFKFGIIYQKFGQVTEEAIFGNRTHSPAMEEFMQLLGQKVRLCEHTGYRGGLDTRHGHTGTFALYEKYHGNEIMFHVSTLLPYVESDDQPRADKLTANIEYHGVITNLVKKRFESGKKH